MRTKTKRRTQLNPEIGKVCQTSSPSSSSETCRNSEHNSFIHHFHLFSYKLQYMKSVGTGNPARRKLGTFTIMRVLNITRISEAASDLTKAQCGIKQQSMN